MEGAMCVSAVCEVAGGGGCSVPAGRVGGGARGAVTEPGEETPVRWKFHLDCCFLPAVAAFSL